jgi:hypothetical protein
MEATATNAITGQTLKDHAGNGVLDRLAGSAIQTKAQYREAHPMFTGEDADDVYRAYRAGYAGK